MVGQRTRFSTFALWFALGVCAIGCMVLVPCVGVALAAAVLLAGGSPMRRLVLCVAVSAIVGAVALRDATSAWRRPMFYNIYGRNDRMILRRWVASPPAVDDIGNLICVDHHLNLLLVVMMPDQTKSREQNETVWDAVWWRLRKAGTAPKVELNLGPPDDKSVDIPRERDRLIIVLSDGDKLVAPLTAGQAEFVDRKYTHSHVLSELMDLVAPSNPGAGDVLLAALERTGS